MFAAFEEVTRPTLGDLHDITMIEISVSHGLAHIHSFIMRKLPILPYIWSSLDD